jgi:hypothetical protein
LGRKKVHIHWAFLFSAPFSCDRSLLHAGHTPLSGEGDGWRGRWRKSPGVIGDGFRHILTDGIVADGLIRASCVEKWGANLENGPLSPA